MCSPEHRIARFLLVKLRTLTPLAFGGEGLPDRVNVRDLIASNSLVQDEEGHRGLAFALGGRLAGKPLKGGCAPDLGWPSSDGLHDRHRRGDDRAYDRAGA